jgi:hypothetical protein
MKHLVIKNRLLTEKELLEMPIGSKADINIVNRMFLLKFQIERNLLGWIMRYNEVGDDLGSAHFSREIFTPTIKNIYSPLLNIREED